jgi:trimeric autotransporter adhesin
MKRTLSAVTLSIVLAYAAAPAFAADSASITQEGSSSLATINQFTNIGTTTAEIVQGQVPNGGGNNETASVLQSNTNGAKALVYQWGDANSSAIVQTNSTDVQVNNVQNWGNSNVTTTYQDNVNVGRISVGQNGNSNSAYINQHSGSNLTAKVNPDEYGQHGSNNSVVMDQTGLDALAVVEQGPGSYNQATIVQVGLGGMNSADITQGGSYSVAYVSQVGSNFTANVVQNLATPLGTGNTASIFQHN